jgi:hypothetical protein
MDGIIIIGMPQDCDLPSKLNFIISFTVIIGLKRMAQELNILNTVESENRHGEENILQK